MTAQRFSLYRSVGYAQMVKDPEGAFVKFEEYEASEQRYEDLLTRIYCGECGHQFVEGECKCDEKRS